MLPGDVVALENALERGDALLEIGQAARVIDHHADEGRHVESEVTRVEQRMVAANHTDLLEFLDPLDDRRRGKAHLLADAGERDLAVLLQGLEDLEIGEIQVQPVAGS